MFLTLQPTRHIKSNVVVVHVRQIVSFCRRRLTAPTRLKRETVLWRTVAVKLWISRSRWYSCTLQAKGARHRFRPDHSLGSGQETVNTGRLKFNLIGCCSTITIWLENSVSHFPLPEIYCGNDSEQFLSKSFKRQDKCCFSLFLLLKSRDNFKMQMFKIRGKQMQSMVVWFKDVIQAACLLWGSYNKSCRNICTEKFNQWNIVALWQIPQIKSNSASEPLQPKSSLIHKNSSCRAVTNTSNILKSLNIGLNDAYASAGCVCIYVIC